MNEMQEVKHFLSQMIPDMIANNQIRIAPMTPEAAEAFKELLNHIKGNKPNE